MTDDEGNVTDKYSYDAWGSLMWHEKLTGSVDQPYQYVGELGYYTHYQDPDLKLLQLGVRFYDAETGRFTQRDPIESSDLTAYVYVDDAPITYVDPSGLTKTIIKDIIDALNDTGKIMDVGKFCAKVWGKANDNFTDGRGDSELGYNNPGFDWVAGACPELRNDYECMSRQRWVGRCTECVKDLAGTPSITGTIEDWIRIYGKVIQQIRKS